MRLPIFYTCNSYTCNITCYGYIWQTAAANEALFQQLRTLPSSRPRKYSNIFVRWSVFALCYRLLCCLVHRVECWYCCCYSLLFAVIRISILFSSSFYYTTDRCCSLSMFGFLSLNLFAVEELFRITIHHLCLEMKHNVTIFYTLLANAMYSQFYPIPLHASCILSH